MNCTTTNSNNANSNKKAQSRVVAITPEFVDPIKEDVSLATTSNVFFGFYGYGRIDYGAEIIKLESVLSKSRESISTELLVDWWKKMGCDNILNQSIANLLVYSVLLAQQDRDYVKEIQGALGVEKDGVVGEKTRNALINKTKNTKGEYDDIKAKNLFNVIKEKWEVYHKNKIEKEKDQKVKDSLIERMDKLADFKFEEGKAYKVSSHRGYDYAADKKEVIAVGKGHVVKVRFGRKDNKVICKHRNCTSIQNNDFDFSKCKNGCNRGCYGVQVWLRLDNSQIYAYYAHLSKLGEKIYSELKNKTVNSYDIDVNIEVEQGEVIGKSGRTGNASKGGPAHLHFECRKGNIETGSQISPNNIVHTKFYIMKETESVFDDTDETTLWSEHERTVTLRRKWKEIRDNIGKYESSKSYQAHTLEIALRSGCDVMKISDKLDVVSNSIAPYQIIKKSRDISRSHAEMSCVFDNVENDLEEVDNGTCDNLTDRMPWRNDLSESCQCLPDNQKN